MQPFKDTVGGLLQEWALAGADFGREQVERTIFGVKQVTDGIAVDWALANEAAAQWAEAYSFELVSGITNTTQTALQREIAGFAESGETFQQFNRRLAGSDLFSAARSEMIAVTEVTRAYAQGNMVTWRESGVTEGKEWNTANDEIVAECPICFPLHEKVIEIDEEFTSQSFSGATPPAHPLCRCWLTPVPIGDM
jgi:SPP1 gp7 family putative phage head morphogenesis protein